MLRSRFLRHLLCFAVICLMSNALVTLAQDLPVEKQSVVVFDFDLATAIKEAQNFGVKPSQFDEIPMEGIFEGMTIREISRVKGSLSLPEQVDDLMAIGLGGDLPMEFYVQFEFSNSDACLMLTENIEAGSDEMVVNGKKFWSPKAGSNGPQGVLGHRPSDTVFEFGTETYLTGKGRDFLTPELETVWKAVPKSTMRLAVDMKTPQDFIGQAVDMSRENAGVQVEAYLDLVEKMQSLSLAADLSGDKLLTLAIAGNDSDDGAEIQSGLDSLIGLAQMGSKFAMAQVSQELPEEAEIMQGTIDSIETTRKENDVRIEIKKPAGFLEAMKKIVAMSEVQAKKVEKQNRFRQAGLAVLNYEAANAEFPFDRDEDELGWRVQVLPYLDEGKLFEQFDLELDLNDEANAKLANKMPSLFGSGGKKSEIVWIKSEVKGFANIIDGSSNTVMLIEYPESEAWVGNGGISVEKAVELVAGLEDGKELIITLYDCSTRKITNKVDKETLKNLFDPADGNVVDWNF